MAQRLLFRRPPVSVGLLLTTIGMLAGCHTLLLRPTPEPLPTPSPPLEAPTPTPVPDELAVVEVQEEIVVAAWAQPPRLPARGGVVQILVRVQKRGGKPFPGVEVRLRTSAGSLESQGALLVTDASGMTRDRLTLRGSAKVTLNAGGTRITFRVPVG